MAPAWITPRSPIAYIPLVLCAILGSAYYLSVIDHVPSLGLHSLVGESKAECYDKYSDIDVVIPEGVRVIAIVFFGRREYVKILDCYLKKNLKEYGGILDEVIFAINTEKEEDLAYAEELLASHERYSKHVVDKEAEGYLGIWSVVTEPESIYIKIDDDVIFIEDTAIPSLARRILNEPEYFAVSANVVNNPALSWVHSRMGAHLPYWPEMVEPEEPGPRSWRPSEIPTYDGPIEGPPNFLINGSTQAPYKGHRWLPVKTPPDEILDLAKFPVSTLTYDAFGPSLFNWASTAQIHYSFLEHLEHGDTSIYKFDKWDFAYKRLSINFIAFRGRDIIEAFPVMPPDDEEFLTVSRPKFLGRRVIVDGSGLAVHFAFGPQYRAHGWKGLTWTDLIDRYRGYAEETVCPLVM